MKKYDVLIIGGGVAGITCALTLASVEDKFPWAKERKYLVIDDGDSDLQKARLFNVPGVEPGSFGSDTMEFMRKQLDRFESVKFIDGKVVKADGKKGEFRVETEDKKVYEADILVFATGMHRFEIEGLDVAVKEHTKVMKPNKIKLENKDLKIRDGLFVAGLAAGSKTMFAIAAGDGAKVACDIFEEWTGKPAVAHDSISKN